MTIRAIKQIQAGEEVVVDFCPGIIHPVEVLDCLVYIGESDLQGRPAIGRICSYKKGSGDAYWLKVIYTNGKEEDMEMKVGLKRLLYFSAAINRGRETLVVRKRKRSENEEA